MNKIWMIRHGQSTSNVGIFTEDPSQIPLTQVGWNQSIRLLDTVFKNEVPDLVVTSPFFRTGETARPLLQTYPEISNQVCNVQEFVNLSPTKLKDCCSTWQERRTASSKYWELCDPFYRDDEKVESFNDLLERVVETKIEIEDFFKDHNSPPKFTAIFTHAEFMKIFWWYCMNCTRNLNSATMMREIWPWMQTFQIRNTAILEITSGYPFDILNFTLKEDHLETVS